MNTNVIEIKQLNFAYENRIVLNNINLKVKQGEFLAILGPNGSGKTTLIKLVLGIESPKSGEVKVLGKSVKSLNEKWRIGYVSQKANNFNQGFPANVKEVVASGLSSKLGIFNYMSKENWFKVHATLDQLGIGHLSCSNIGELSGGLQQRVLIARALVSDPELLILDEPTVGVDSSSTEKFYELLSYLHKDKGLSLVMVTHDVGAISTAVDEIVCINKRVFYHGKPEEFEDLQSEIMTNAYGHDVDIVKHNH